MSDPGTWKASQFETYGKLLEATAYSIHGTAGGGLTARDFKETELLLLQRIQGECFATDVVPATSRLVTLAPELMRQSTLLD